MSFLGEERYRQLTQSFNVLKCLLRPKHEPEIAYRKKLVVPGDTVFEIGANYGQYSRVLSKLVGTSGCIHAFEPASITCNLLVRKIHLLRFANVTPHRIAPCDQSGSAS
jgi:tRNA A58 N-methylase Trm61